MSIPTADLRALVAKWNEEARKNEGRNSAQANALGLGYERCVDDLDALIVKAEAQVGEEAEQRIALDKSVKLQSHYAGLLNAYDGGKRLQFASSDEWIERLRALGASPAPPKDTL